MITWRVRAHNRAIPEPHGQERDGNGGTAKCTEPQGRPDAEQLAEAAADETAERHALRPGRPRARVPVRSAPVEKGQGRRR
jgi:hypothetical protein